MNAHENALARAAWAKEQEADAAYVRGEQECAECVGGQNDGVVCATCGGTAKNPHGRFDLVCFIADCAHANLEDAIAGVSHALARLEHEIERRDLGVEHAPIPANVERLVRALREGGLGAQLCLVSEALRTIHEEMNAAEATDDTDDSTHASAAE